MKKLLSALALVGLLAAPSSATTYWVSPTGTSGASGADSTTNAKSLAWVNSNAAGGDIIRFKSGTYTDAVAPTRTNVSSARIRYYGFPQDPSAVSVAKISFTSVCNGDGRYETARWITSRSSIEINSCYGEANLQDSVVKCVALNGGATIQGQSCVMDSLTLTGSLTSGQAHFVTIGGQRGSPITFPPNGGWFSGATNNQFKHSTVNCTINTTGAAHVVYVATGAYNEISDNTINATLIHYTEYFFGMEQYYSYNLQVLRNTWNFVVSDNVHSGTRGMWSMRDSSRYTRYIDNIVNITGSASGMQLPCLLSNSGSYAGTTGWSLYSGNQFSNDIPSNFGVWYWQNGSRFDTLQFNVVKTNSANPCIRNEPGFGGQDWNGTVMRHNTFYSAGPTIVDLTGSLVGNSPRIVSGIYYSTGTTSANNELIKVTSGIRVDSAGVYFARGGAAATAIQYNSVDGAPGTGGNFGVSGKALWCSPQFTDSSYTTFNARLVTGSCAVGGSLHDGFAGAYADTTGTGADVTAPGAVTNLTAVATTPDTVLLIFTAPGDDATSGAANHYLVHYRTANGLTNGRWDAANTYAWYDFSAAPKYYGATDTVVVYNLAPDKLYWFGLKAVDEAGNTSVCSNSDSAWTPAMADPETNYPRFALYGGAGATPLPHFWPTLLADSLTRNSTEVAYLSRFQAVSFNPEAGGADSFVSTPRYLQPRVPKLYRFAEPGPNVSYIQRHAYSPSDTAGFATDGIHQRDNDGIYYYNDADSVFDGAARYNPHYLYYNRQWKVGQYVDEWTRGNGWGPNNISDTTGALPAALTTTGTKGYLWRASPKCKGFFAETGTYNVAGTTTLNMNFGFRVNGTYPMVDSLVALYKLLYYDRMFTTMSGTQERMYDGIMFDLFTPRLDQFTDIDAVRAGYPGAGGRDSLNANWTGAHVLLAKKMRQTFGKSFILTANGYSGTHYGPYFNGYMREYWPQQQGGNWFTNFWWFVKPTTTALAAAPGEGGQVTDWHAFKYKPQFHWIFNVPPGCASGQSCGGAVKDTAAAVESWLRFSLGTAALTGAYSMYGPSDASMARDSLYRRYWFDEYAVNTADGTASINSAYFGWLGAPQDTFYQKLGALSTTNVMLSQGATFETTDSTKWTRTMSGQFGRVTIATDDVYGGSRCLVAYVYNDSNIAIPADYSVQALANKVFTVKDGQTWSIRFFAKADWPRPINVWLRRISNGQNVQTGNISGATNSLCRLWVTKTWKQYSWPVVVQTSDSTTSGVAVQVAFGFGDTTGTVRIDNVSCNQGKKDTYIREFDNGVVLVNEDAVQDTVQFDRATRRIMARSGNAPDVVNDGHLIPNTTNIYVPAQSSTFLLWASDSLRPGPVTGFSARTVSNGASTRLIWTTPGNDSTTGTASSYDIRFHAGTSFLEADWATAIQIQGVRAPKAAGALDTMDVDNDRYDIQPGVNYVFALKTTDSFRQQSALGDTAGLLYSPADITPPAVCDIDSTQRIGRTSVMVFIRQPGSDGAGGGAVDHYIVKYSTDSIDDGTTWSAASTAVDGLAGGTPGTVLGIPVHIGRRGTFNIAVRAVDASGNISDFGTLAQVTVARRRGALTIFIGDASL